MEGFPADFNQKVIENKLNKKINKKELLQHKIKEQFRFDLYKKYKQILEEYSNDDFRETYLLKFSFPKELTETSKFLLLSEIFERFNKIYYQDKSYTVDDWQILKEIKIYHSQYAIKII